MFIFRKQTERLQPESHKFDLPAIVIFNSKTRRGDVFHKAFHKLSHGTPITVYRDDERTPIP